jgi:hypothetical protein
MTLIRASRRPTKALPMPDPPEIYETRKMRVAIGEERVEKTFKERPGYKSRYRREKVALQRLKGVPGVPELIEFSDEVPRLVTSRLPGGNVEELSDEALGQIRGIINEALERGIARHSLPIRDILVDDAGKVGMVDFERITIRCCEWGIIWQIAKRITRFHLLRLCHRHNPATLSPGELRIVERGAKVRQCFGVFRKLFIPVRNLWRRNDK